jgi:hypothetical protein
VPLLHQNEVVGILYVDDFKPREFARTSLEELEILSSFASIAIHHARMHTDVKQQAITDSLTGLFNRRCFEDILNRELQRADRHHRDCPSRWWTWMISSSSTTGMGIRRGTRRSRPWAKRSGTRSGARTLRRATAATRS